MPFETYATTDDSMETSERLSKADIIYVVRKQHSPDTDDEDGEDPDSGSDTEVLDSDVCSFQESNADSVVAADEGKISCKFQSISVHCSTAESLCSMP